MKRGKRRGRAKEKAIVRDPKIRELEKLASDLKGLQKRDIWSADFQSEYDGVLKELLGLYKKRRVKK